MNPELQKNNGSYRISALARESGLSKELIHHYLREGLLPQPENRGHYGSRYLELLRLIKRLRDERFLPLPVIRRLMVLNGHDPERVELVLLASPDADATSERLSLEDLEVRTRVPRRVIESYVARGLIRPAGGSDSEHFTRQDVNVVALVSRGTALGIPIDSFRTIRSYVELAFELEQSLFVPPPLLKGGPAEFARELAARREIANGFIANVLTGLFNARLRQFFEEIGGEAKDLSGAGYRPSEAFLLKHGVQADLDELRRSLGRRGRKPALLARLAKLLFLAGRYREAVFTAEQALGARGAGESAAIRRVHGYALLFAGEANRGLRALEEARTRYLDDPALAAYLAAARLQALAQDGGGEAMLSGLGDVMQLADEALEGSAGAPTAEATEARLICGWVMSSLPEQCRRFERGRRALEAAYRATSPKARPALAPEALRVSLRIRAAHFLWRAIGRDPAAVRGARRRRAALVGEVLRLDPTSELARTLYLAPEQG